MHTVEEITESVIGMVIAIHRDLGPGLLESAYQRILYDELVAAGFSVELEQLVAVTYNGRRYEHSFRADMVVEKKLVLEIKATERASSLHTRQLLTYLRAALEFGTGCWSTSGWRGRSVALIESSTIACPRSSRVRGTSPSTAKAAKSFKTSSSHVVASVARIRLVAIRDVRP